MAAYVALLLGVTWYFRHYQPVGAVAYLLAILPAIPIIGTIVIVGLYLAEEQDEFQRTLLIQSMLCALAAVMAITTVWGFLEAFTNIPHLQPYLVFPLFWFFVGVATPMLKRRYR
jgi:nitric oxide reductase large subunit